MAGIETAQATQHHRLTNWDPEAIALADDDLRLKTATIAT